MPSLVCIIPTALKDQANALSYAANPQDGPENFSQPIGDSHYYLRADRSEEYVANLLATKEGIWPEGLDVPEWADAVMQAMIIDASDELWGREHLDAVIEAHGLISEQAEA